MCKYFHWTPQDLDEAPAQDVRDFAMILRYVDKFTPKDHPRG